ncbi:Uncharacterised protein [uncultured archaeon]|nr:Uncharacterised protein [uncultured archaeon]
MSQFVKKEWGCENWLVNEPEYCAKELFVKAGKQCSLHYHPIKKETFRVYTGDVWLQYFPITVEDPLGVIGVIVQTVHGEQYHILPGVRHRFGATSDAVILEVSTHHDDADVVRLEPSGDLNLDAWDINDAHLRDFGV